ncbi:ATP-dependent DNA helicase [Cutibacterium acnes JCM 18909]|nr:ATP-dependent DNA helicase [Cutibacterium acnes JCM 18909]
MRRRSAERHDAPVCSRRDGGLLAAFEDRLPFTPTVGQDKVSRVIDADLSADRPMHRLLQGEVGSGKKPSSRCERCCRLLTLGTRLSCWRRPKSLLSSITEPLSICWATWRPAGDWMPRRSPRVWRY